MSNFVFSRRSLQQAIDRLAHVLARDQLVSIVDRLNRRGESRLSAMWEIVVLDALKSIGPLRHEVELSNGRRPDFEIAAKLDDGGDLQIVGDVVTISDAGLDESNPVEDLQSEVTRLAKKYSLNPNHFGYDVRGDRIGPYGDGRIQLRLPPRPELFRLIKSEVEPWFRALTANPTQAGQLQYDKTPVSFLISYNPRQRYAGGGHLSYEVAASRDKNPLFKALKEKAKQLKKAPRDAVRVVIVCDGDCRLLRQTSLMQSSGTYSAQDIARDFLRQNRSIGAIAIVKIDERLQPLDRKHKLTMKYDFVLSERPASSQEERRKIDTVAGMLTSAFCQKMPAPKMTAYNAILRSKEPGFGPDMIGGFTLSGNKISLSSRALQRLLAGNITIDAFLEAHGWNIGGKMRNPFLGMAQSGQMIKQIDVKNGGDKDDDWLEFQFGSPDPAVTKFAVPDSDDTLPKP